MLSVLAQGLKVLTLRKNYDVVLTTTGTGLFLALSRFLLRWEKPFLCEIMYQVDTSGKSAKSILYKILRTTVRANVDRIICVASSQKKSFSMSLRIPEKRIEYVPLGIDTEFYRSERTSSEVNSVLCVGDADRDEVTLVRAVRNLPVKLVRVSDEPRISEVFKKMNYGPRRSNLDKIVVLKGVSDIEIKRLYTESVIAVVPIYQNSREPAGLTSLLEAMAMGKTVIVTKGLSSEDYVIDDKTGIIVEPGNVEQLEKAIVQLLGDDSKRNRIGNCACQCVQKNFNIERNAEKLAICLQKLVNETI